MYGCMYVSMSLHLDAGQSVDYNIFQLGVGGLPKVAELPLAVTAREDVTHLVIHKYNKTVLINNHWKDLARFSFYSLSYF